MGEEGREPFAGRPAEDLAEQMDDEGTPVAAADA